MFIDRHDIPGAKPEDVAEAHSADVGVQSKYGVRFHTYWFDPTNGSVFCLAEAPDADSVNRVHHEAHGEVASTVVELDQGAPLNAFLGAPPAFPVGTAYAAPAMRAIVFTDLCGSTETVHRLGDDGFVLLLRDHDAIVRSALGEHDGREVKHTGDGIMASFTSVVAAVSFAIALQRALHLRNDSAEHPLRVRVGISAGEPITGDNDDLFGAAVTLAARLCDAAEPAGIAVSTGVRELCIGKPFRFSTLGARELKGMPEPVHVHAVAWDE